MDLQGQVIMVTGASSGIGMACARLLMPGKAHLVLVARRGEKLRELTQEVKAAGGEALALAADFARAEQIEKAFGQVADTFGRLDVLINSAGLGVYGLVREGKTQDWRRMIDLNLFGLICATQQALHLMLPQKRGHIINVSSVAGRISIPGWAVYVATKWGVNGFTDSLRREVCKENIRVTLIEPGAVDTPWGENIPESFQAQRTVFLNAEDVARAIIYAIEQPLQVSINEILLRPTQQER
jgi:NADP-dependent 3-hydroxy acid dehydrogenase YdfG